MDPQFVVQAARVIAKEHVVAPLLVGAGIRVQRARDVRLAGRVEFLFGAQFATVRTEDMQHRGFLLLVGDGRSAVFVDQRTVVETVDGKRCGQRVHFTLGQAGGKHVA